MTVGIPRALLYYRYRLLWKTFFSELGIATVVSPKTNKSILDMGCSLAVDENCLSSKLFFGHVAALFGNCDIIFVPRITGEGQCGRHGLLCSRFEALYDICENIFRDQGILFLTCNVDPAEGESEAGAFAGMAGILGKTRRKARAAYEKARLAWEEDALSRLRAEEEKSLKDGVKILVISHSYNLRDEYIGLPILQYIEKLGAVPICPDAPLCFPYQRHGKGKSDSSPGQRLPKSTARRLHEPDSLICDRAPWLMSRELLKYIDIFRDRTDGIILITAFPCGPDSLINEMILRRVTDRPILNLILDAQDAQAGIETRIESFIDIIRFRRKAGASEPAR